MEDFGGESTSPIPTTFGLFNTGGSDQIGDYSNPTADSLINESITGTNPNAVKAEASFLRPTSRCCSSPTADHIWAWKTSISGTSPESFENLTQYYLNAGNVVPHQVTRPAGWTARSPVIHRRPGHRLGR